jgi:outer membrane protein assembly factor BamD
VSIRIAWTRGLGIFSAAFLVVAAGCSPVPDLGEATAGETYEIGKEALEREEYLVAIEALSRVSLESPMHEFADDALLGLADAHRALGDFASAEAEYRRVLSDYPRSTLVPEATYKLALSFYEQSLPAALDQGMTRRAIEQFERFLAAYPGTRFAVDAETKISELRARLAEKEYDVAVLYFALDDPQAARIYLEAVADEYPDTAWARKALLALARSLRDEGSTARASDVYERLTETYPGTAEAASAASEIAALAP